MTLERVSSGILDIDEEYGKTVTKEIATWDNKICYIYIYI